MFKVVEFEVASIPLLTNQAFAIDRKGIRLHYQGFGFGAKELSIDGSRLSIKINVVLMSRLTDCLEDDGVEYSVREWGIN